MSSLVIGGTSIPVAVSSPSFSRSDAVDRGRTFDNTSFASQTGGAARAWSFTTPPVVPGLYEPTLGIVAAQLCSGDILALPTMCHVEFLGGKPVRAQGTKVTLDFVLHEVQPAKVLLRYAPGDTITGESFTRSTTAYQVNASGVPVSVAINTKRAGHYVGGVRHILLEGPSTNLILRGNDLSHAAWTRTTLTVATGVADPAGGTAACTLTATGANSNAYQNGGDGSSIVRTASMWIRRRTGSGAVVLITPAGGNTAPLAITGTWTRFSGQGVAHVSRYCGVQLATSGDEVDVWCPQCDDMQVPTSEIPTTTASVTRESDFYSLPAPPPQELSLYVRMTELGTIYTPNARLAQISNAASGDPRLILYNSGGFYQTLHGNGTANVSSTNSAAGNSGEQVARLFGDGSVDNSQSVGEAAPTTGPQSAANALSTAWSGPLLWLNSAGTAGSAGFTAIRSVKVLAGARSLAEMRSA